MKGLSPKAKMGTRGAPRSRRETGTRNAPLRKGLSPHGSIHANVYAAMKHALMRGSYKPGQKITIRGVAASLGTSATPVREAIRRLIAEGAVEHLHAGRARLPDLTQQRLAEITEVRVALETLAARRAARHMSNDEIANLESIQVTLEQARDRKDYSTYLANNEAFHFAYYRACAMPNLLRVIESMWLQAGPYLTLLLPAMRGIDLHASAIDAARRHDGEAAAAAIEEDIRRAATRLATLLEPAA